MFITLSSGLKMILTRRIGIKHVYFSIVFNYESGPQSMTILIFNRTIGWKLYKYK